MCVCHTIIFESLDVGISYLHIWCIQGIRVKFVYEGHRVEVKEIEIRHIFDMYSENKTSENVTSPDYCPF